VSFQFALLLICFGHCLVIVMVMLNDQLPRSESWEFLRSVNWFLFTHIFSIDCY